MMSRCYGMQVLIDNVQEDRIPNIKEAAEQEWKFHDWTQGEQNSPTNLAAYGEGSLCGGESEEEFTDRLACAIWKANGKFCQVTVQATDLEDLPFESHERDEEDYHAFCMRVQIQSVVERSE